MGFSQQRMEPFSLLVSKGLVTNHSPVIVDGRTSNLGTVLRDVWDGNPEFIQVPPDDADIHIISNDTNDNFTNGTGARSVLVLGLDKNFNQIFEIVQMTGFVGVTLVNKFKRINNVFVQTTGVLKHNVGDIFIYFGGVANPTDQQNNQMTFMRQFESFSQNSAFFVPAGFTLFIKDMVDTTEKNKDAVVTFVGINEQLIEFSQDLFLFQNTINIDLSYIAIIPEKSGFTMRAISQGTNNNISTRAFGVLVKN